MTLPILGTITIFDGIWIFAITAVFESITLFFRFFLGKKSAQDTRFLANFTFGLRIHHGYIGVVLLLFNKHLSIITSIPSEWFIRIGWGLILSDIIHHFILWVVTKNADLDLVYPKN